jgi:hypothetical protein
MKPVLKITWIDRGLEPQCQPNPRYPTGIDIDVTNGARRSCKTDLPYPAQRCGLWLVQCENCGNNIIITTAGRVDDPRSVRLPCQPGGVQ